MAFLIRYSLMQFFHGFPFLVLLLIIDMKLIVIKVILIVIFVGNFTCLMVEFKFRRRLGYFMFHTYIPTCLIVMMSWISFWIKPEAVPARVTLGVTSLLTLSTPQYRAR